MTQARWILRLAALPSKGICEKGACHRIQGIRPRTITQLLWIWWLAPFSPLFPPRGCVPGSDENPEPFLSPGTRNPSRSRELARCCPCPKGLGVALWGTIAGCRLFGAAGPRNAKTPAKPGDRRGLKRRGSGRSRTDDGGFAIGPRTRDFPRKTMVPGRLTTPLTTPSPQTQPSPRWSRRGRTSPRQSGRASWRWCRPPGHEGRRRLSGPPRAPQRRRDGSATEALSVLPVAVVSPTTRGVHSSLHKGGGPP
jgi:hypothetical protein